MIEKLITMIRNDQTTLSAKEASRFLGCTPQALCTAAKSGRFGTLQFYWAGNELRVSTWSVLNFLRGAYPTMNEYFKEGGIEQR